MLSRAAHGGPARGGGRIGASCRCAGVDRRGRARWQPKGAAQHAAIRRRPLAVDPNTVEPRERGAPNDGSPAVSRSARRRGLRAPWCREVGKTILRWRAAGATLLLNCVQPPDEVWDALPRPVQEKILAKRIEVYAIDAARIARDAGLAGRTNTVLQTCFFAISGVLPREEAIAKIKSAIAKTYGRRGAEVVARTHAAVDATLAGLHRIEVPGQVTSGGELPAVVPAGAPEFV